MVFKADQDIPYLDRLELVMGSEVGYGLRKPLAAEDMGYMLGVCLEYISSFINRSSDRQLSVTLVMNVFFKN